MEDLSALLRIPGGGRPTTAEWNPARYPGLCSDRRREIATPDTRSAATIDLCGDLAGRFPRRTGVVRRPPRQQPGPLHIRNQLPFDCGHRMESEGQRSTGTVL